jgi:Serine dehydrogenase proteinase
MPNKVSLDDPIQAAVWQLEKMRGSRIFMMIQGSEDHLCDHTMALVRTEFAGLPKVDTLEIVLHSGGGHAEVAYAAMNILRGHCKRLNVLVPRYAKSAATLMCLGADMIFMGEFAELGPLDVQITDIYDRGARPFSPLDEFKSMEFLREYSTELFDYFSLLLVERSGMSVKEALHESIPALVGLMAPMYARIDPTKVGSYRRALAIGEEYAKRLLKRRRVANAEQIVDKLVWSYPSHDFVIDATELRQLGLQVTRIPEEQEAILQTILDGTRNGISVYGFADRPAKPRRKPAKRKARAKATAGVRPARPPELKAIQ